MSLRAFNTAACLLAERLAIVVATTLAAFLFAGCNTTGATRGEPVSDRYAVTSELAPFYKQGPAQGYGPDASLKEGTIVTMLKRGFGYSQVSTPAYGEGWMATSDLQPAPPEPNPEAAPVGSTASNIRSTPYGSGDYNNPELLEASEAALPEPEPEPAPVSDKPKPAFRY